MLQTAGRKLCLPGTTGWSVDDFADPEIARELGDGRYEITDGVLTNMAPQGYGGTSPLAELRMIIEEYARTRSPGLRCIIEVDLQLGNRRVARPDMSVLTGEQNRAQKEEMKRRGIKPGRYLPLVVMPLLIVESVSLRGEDHDRITKRQWYAEAGIENYWILTGFEQSLVCLRLEGGEYVTEAEGRDGDRVQSSLFGGMEIELGRLW